MNPDPSFAKASEGKPHLRALLDDLLTPSGETGGPDRAEVLALLRQERVRRRQRQAGFPGNDWLVGISDPVHVADPDFLVRWLRHVPGRVVELMCHPGHPDGTLLGRDATPTDGQLQRRVQEYHLLRQPSFWQTCRAAGFQLAAPAQLHSQDTEVEPHAA